MKRIILLIVSALFLTSQVSAWTVKADFEKGVLGQLANGESGFGYAMSGSHYSNNYARNGSKSAQATIQKGATSGMGGTFFFPSTPQKGDGFWFRCGIFFPTGFDLTVGGSGLKLFRLQTSNGYFNMLIRDAGLNLNTPAGPLFVDNNSERSHLGPGIPRNKWITFETYLKLDPDHGIWRIWQDGKLVFEDTQTFTMKYPDTVGKRILVFTYWNGNAPATQSAYVDDCVLTSDRPSKTDSHGNPYIGVGDFEAVAAPNPPKIDN